MKEAIKLKCRGKLRAGVNLLQDQAQVAAAEINNCSFCGRVLTWNWRAMAASWNVNGECRMLESNNDLKNLTNKLGGKLTIK